MDAASTGEAARLRAAIESLKGELDHVRQQHVCFGLMIII